MRPPFELTEHQYQVEIHRLRFFSILCEMLTLITNKLKTIGLFTIDIRNK